MCMVQQDRGGSASSRVVDHIVQLIEGRLVLRKSWGQCFALLRGLFLGGGVVKNQGVASVLTATIARTQVMPQSPDDEYIQCSPLWSWCPEKCINF